MQDVLFVIWAGRHVSEFLHVRRVVCAVEDVFFVRVGDPGRLSTFLVFPIIRGSKGGGLEPRDRVRLTDHVEYRLLASVALWCGDSSKTFDSARSIPGLTWPTYVCSTSLVIDHDQQKSICVFVTGSSAKVDLVVRLGESIETKIL
ncbi:hypothetical protein OUZ56_025491 [Daphnia magna]|uniref:Uncharacterized protein n=1 Tax=Daphnia magna TaxID=35525 RepID=A0ABQ9ZK18_9CRUS|nr:hypothetical protein OUZ56_025491 [Daphnia magna]